MPLRVLISRTDRIGDVVLALPLCGLLKRRLGAHVTLLVRGYTRPVLEASEHVDAIVDWDEGLNETERRALVGDARPDVMLHVFPRPEIARAGWAARVPQRVGTSRRLYHWIYCNRLERLSRKGSALHEAQLNVHLARSLLGDVTALTPEALAPLGRLRPRVHVPIALAPFVRRDRFVLVLHPKSGGSAREWPLAHYRALVDALPAGRFRVLITGSREEAAGMRGWLDALPPHAHDLTGRATLAELIALLAAVDGVVAASTGPLHLAAALGTRALGLYAPTRPIHAERWAPLGERATAISPPEPCAGCRAGAGGGHCACLTGIAVDTVRERVTAWAAECTVAGGGSAAEHARCATQPPHRVAAE